MATTAPFGTWPSPITPQLVVTGARAVSELRVDGDDLCWLEQRPDESGRTVVVRLAPDGSTRDVSPPGTDVRTRVHEYGGGSYLVAGGTTWYVDGADQRVHRLDDGAGAPRPITPRPVRPGGLRYADFTLTPDGSHLICVRESHGGPRAVDVVNELVALPADGAGEPIVIARGHDFYASPRLSVDGRRLAYTTWDHPNMPWDDTAVVLAELDGTTVRDERTLTGAGESAILPAFAPDGALHFLSDRTGWWNLYRVDADGTLANVADLGVDLGQPQWSLGQSLYGFLPDGRVAVVAVEAAVERPSLLDPSTGELVALSDHTMCRHLVVDGSTVWFAGSSPTAFQEVVRVDVPAAGDAGEVRVVHRTRDLPVDTVWLPRPEALSFPTAGAETAHAFLYPPTSPDHEGPQGAAPPLIVIGHGGPTASSPPLLSLETAYWTSRGFAVVDVNYRGSTGFGRAYRQALRKRWCVADVQDCEAAATHLAERGAVDGTRRLIRGRSAGGSTTLCALAFTEAFAAGASYFGVADLAALARETHKFESRYLDGLIGPYPQERATYEARSPLLHAERISCPVILFQGLQDRVVPPSQAQEMISALAANGIPHAYVAFPEEQHGFRDAANQVRCLEAELSFYTQVLGLPHPEGLPAVEVAHGGDARR